MLREIRLYGDLGKRFGKIHRFAVQSTAEAIRALMANFPDFERAMLEVAPGYRILAGRTRITETDALNDPVSSHEPIRIVPVIAGAKSKWTGILLGAAILAAVVLTGGVALGASGLVFSGVGAQLAFGVGASLVLGGISQILSPTPKMDTGALDGQESKNGFAFSGSVNTTAQGNPVPICYGVMRCGSAVISAGITAKDIPA